MEQRDAIRLKMSTEKLSYTWLIRQLERKGLIVPKSELSSVLSGTRTGKKSTAIITAVQEILAEYDRVFLGSNEQHDGH